MVKANCRGGKYNMNLKRVKAPKEMQGCAPAPSSELASVIALDIHVPIGNEEMQKHPLLGDLKAPYQTQNTA